MAYFDHPSRRRFSFFSFSHFRFAPGAEFSVRTNGIITHEGQYQIHRRGTCRIFGRRKGQSSPGILRAPEFQHHRKSLPCHGHESLTGTHVERASRPEEQTFTRL